MDRWVEFVSLISLPKIPLLNFMKTAFPKSFCRLVAAGLILAASAGLSRADIPVFVEAFPDTNSVSQVANYNPPPTIVRYDYGTATANATHSVAWSANDAQTNANSGSVKLSWNWNWTADSDGAAAFSFDLFNFANTMTNASNLSFDVMVDPASAVGTNNGYGFFEVVTRDANYAYNKISGFNAELGQNGTGKWQHFSIPLTGVYTAVRALTFQDYNDAFRQINGTVTIYMDNITLSIVGEITNVLSLTPPANKGLIMQTTDKPALSEPAQYQRQDIRTVADTGFNWIGAENPMTYSITITNYPPPPFTNFLTYVLLAPGSPTVPNPDYAGAHVVYFDLQNQADGSMVGTFRYKVNDVNNLLGFLYNEGTLGFVTNASPLGTWSMTLSQNTNVTITAPGGATLSTNIPDADATLFAGNLRVYIGDQANFPENVGQKAIYSRFQIVSNSTSLLDDRFSSLGLNASTWVVAAEDPQGILQVSPDTAYLLSWNLPDTGFRLTIGTNLANPNQWRSNTLPVSVFNGRRTVPIPAAMLVTNNPGFFHLVSP
jgi:hypothetical protein